MTLIAARRLLLSALLCIALALVATACGDDSAGGSGGSGGKVACGTTQDGKLQIVHHCGDASGEVTVNGATTKLDEGACKNTATSVVVNLGDNIGDPTPTKSAYERHPYIGVVAGKFPGAAPTTPAVAKDGVYDTGVYVSAVAGGAPLALPTAKLELSGGRTKGTFTGTDTNGAKISGSFSCN
jgi:hypothetical protein